MLETIIVIVIISAAAALILRSLYRSTSGKKSGCGCAGSCPVFDKCTIKKLSDNR